MMQLGFTMQEKMEFDAGQVTNASLADYKIPSILDIPTDMQNEVVEAEQGSGPFGAKGVGESGTFGVSPAIANAIEDAVGVRLTALPLTAEAVYRALRAARRASRWRSECRTIHFTLNGEKVAAEVAPHQTSSSCCAIASICSARAKAARRACAAAAPCWSTARGVGLSLSRGVRRRQDGYRPSSISRRMESSARCRRPSSKRARSSAASARRVSS